MAVSRINEAGLNVNQYGNRNLIINGAMQVAQRGTSSTGVTTSDGYYSCDRWYTQTDTGTWTISQSTDAPAGFAHSLKLDCTTAGTSNGDEIDIRARFEGQNLQGLAYGSSDAKSITVSFYVKSNQTGTYTVAFWNANSTQQRNVSQTYTINSANTWEYKTLTIAGDTSRSINNANTADFQVLWYFAAASGFTSGTQNTSGWADLDFTTFVNSDIVGLGGSTSDYVQITGVQLEVGDTATDFEHRTFADELIKCKRYFTQWTGTANQTVGVGTVITSTTSFVGVQFPIEMRTGPTITQSSTYIYEPAASTVSSLGTIYNDESSAGVNITHSSGLTTGRAAMWNLTATGSYVRADAEL